MPETSMPYKWVVEVANLLISAMGLEALDSIESDPNALCNLNKLDFLEDLFAEDNINSSSAQSQPSQEQQVLLPCWPAGPLPWSPA